MYYSCSCAASCASSPSGCCADYASCCATTDPCNGVGYEGCCKSNTVYYCENSALANVLCTGTTNPYCGWNSGVAGYDCMTTNTGADPDGTFPMACPF